MIFFSWYISKNLIFLIYQVSIFSQKNIKNIKILKIYLNASIDQISCQIYHSFLLCNSFNHIWSLRGQYGDFLKLFRTWIIFIEYHSALLEKFICTRFSSDFVGRWLKWKLIPSSILHRHTLLFSNFFLFQNLLYRNWKDCKNHFPLAINFEIGKNSKMETSVDRGWN